MLKLSRVDTMPKIDGMPRQPFTLIFSGPPGDVLPEGQRTFESTAVPPSIFTSYPGPHAAARPPRIIRRYSIETQDLKCNDVTRPDFGQAGV